MRFNKKYLLLLLLPLIAWGAVEWGNLTVKGNLLVGSAGELSHTIGGSAILSKIEAQSQGGTDPGGIAVHRNSASDALGGHFLALRSRGTAAAPTVVSSGDIIMRLAGVAYDGTDYEFGSEIRFEVDGTPGSNDMPGRILFLVSPDGSGTQAEALRIANDKKVTFAGTIDTALSTAGPAIVDSSGVLSSEATLAIARGGTAKALTLAAGGVIYSDADSFEVTAAGTSAQYLKSNGSSAPTWATFTQPTVQTFTSGSGTYTTPAGVKSIEILVVGSGASGTGAGTASASSNGVAGDNSTFGTALLTANGGSAVNYSAATGGTGGGFTVSSPAIDIGSSYGDSGGGSIFQSGASYAFPGGQGGSTCLGGGGKAGHASTGGNAQTNSGGGGAGGGTDGANEYSGGGGGGGGCVRARINAPDSSYAYAVGAAKTGGAAGTSGFAGGNSAAGKIIVIEYYQ